MSSKEPRLPPNERCPECKGRGSVWTRLFLGYKTCPECHGRGKCELKQRPLSPPPPPPDCEVCKDKRRIVHFGTASGWTPCPACVTKAKPRKLDTPETMKESRIAESLEATQARILRVMWLTMMGIGEDEIAKDIEKKPPTSPDEERVQLEAMFRIRERNERVKHSDTIPVPIPLIRDLATKAWMRNDIATADLLYGLLGETTATQHERSDDAP